MTAVVESFATEVRESGWRRAVGTGLAHTRQLLWTDETQTWFELQLRRSCRGASEAKGPWERRSALSLLAGSTEHLPRIDGLGFVSQSVATRRLAEGVRWWLLVDEDQPVCSCWTFSRVMPMIGAPAGALILPPDVTFLDDVVTSQDRRGAGTGSLALKWVCQTLADEGAERMLTRVTLGNKASERMMLKVGFRPVATVRIRRRGMVNQTWAVMSADAVSTWLPNALGAIDGSAAGGSRPVRWPGSSHDRAAPTGRDRGGWQ